jgi:hypothetical protein
VPAWKARKSGSDVGVAGHGQKTGQVGVHVADVHPALFSHANARGYLGDPSASKYFADLLPELDIVRFGRRSFVTRESLDRLIDRHRIPRRSIP